LEGTPQGKHSLTRLASPVVHLDPKDPPTLLIHGDADPQMPFQQSEEFEKACKAAGVPVILHTVVGGKHGGSEFYDASRMEIVRCFLKDHLSQ
jgi:dipeptidyl aminopeptidase/acylaminoacyl peptidase